jgi:3-dehydroquinate synthase class II
MTNNKTNFTATELIEKRENAINDIKKYWGIIYAENVLAENQKPDFDIKAIYKKVSETELDLIKIKIAVQAVNMGLSSMEEMKSDNLYFQIYLLQQLKERKVKLERIPFSTKKGETTTFKKPFIDSELKAVNDSIKTVEGEMKKYNLTKKFKL